MLHLQKPMRCGIGKAPSLAIIRRACPDDADEEKVRLGTLSSGYQLACQAWLAAFNSGDLIDVASQSSFLHQSKKTLTIIHGVERLVQATDAEDCGMGAGSNEGEEGED